jgi:hypothetical protein
LVDEALKPADLELQVLDAVALTSQPVVCFVQILSEQFHVKPIGNA